MVLRQVGKPGGSTCYHYHCLLTGYGQRRIPHCLLQLPDLEIGQVVHSVTRLLNKICNYVMRVSAARGTIQRDYSPSDFPLPRLLSNPTHSERLTMATRRASI